MTSWFSEAQPAGDKVAISPPFTSFLLLFPACYRHFSIWGHAASLWCFWHKTESDESVVSRNGCPNAVQPIYF
jgi:hypothetical protein